MREDHQLRGNIGGKQFFGRQAAVVVGVGVAQQKAGQRLLGHVLAVRADEQHARLGQCLFHPAFAGGVLLQHGLQRRAKGMPQIGHGRAPRLVAAGRWKN